MTSLANKTELRDGTINVFENNPFRVSIHKSDRAQVEPKISSSLQLFTKLELIFSST